MPLSAKVEIFISCVSDEFGRWREEVVTRGMLGMDWCFPVSQEYFVNSTDVLLADLNTKISRCRAMIHLIGRCIGRARSERAIKDVETFMADHEEIVTFLLPHFGQDRQAVADMSYTQWEAWLAVYYRLDLRVFAITEPTVGWQSRNRPPYTPTTDEADSQARHRQRLYQRNERAIEVPDITFLGMSMLREVAGSDGILAVWLKGLAEKFCWPEQQVADLKGLLFSPASASTLGPAFVVPTAIRILGDLDRPIPPTQEAHFHLFAELASRPKWQDLATLALLAKKRAHLSGQPALTTALSHWLDTALATRQWTAAQLEGHAMEHLQHLRADGLPHVVLEVSWERDPNVDPRLVTPVSYLRIGGQPWSLGSGAGHVLKRDVVTQASRSLRSHRCAASCLPQRAEVFLHGETAEELFTPWDLRDSNLRPHGRVPTHPWPVVLRLRRDPFDWEDLDCPPDPFDHQNIHHLPADPAPTFSPCLCGMFFSCQNIAQVSTQESVARLASSTGLGLWSRQDLAPGDAQYALEQLHSTPLADLPARLHGYKLGHHGSHNASWLQIALLYDHPDLTADASSRFPQPRNLPPPACPPGQLFNQLS